ncbi:MAG: SGNH/GDSL hydrolase family protein [Chloroflexi bacterium]|nr:SGNH/GDSL hydrolase family protein [Chloroflexota bacterium]
MVKYFQKHNSYLFFIKFSAWLLFFLFVLEVFTRSFIMETPSEHFIPGLGNIAVDNSVTVNGIEGFGVTHFLANGEIITPYQSGVPVVVLGDSFTEGGQVSDNKKYVSVAETILHDRGVSMDLLNLGYSGRSLPDYVYIAPYIKKTYSPAIVVVQLNLADFVESFDKTKENYFVRNEMSVELMHNEAFSTNQLVLRNIVRAISIGSLVRYKFKSINLIPEQQLRLLAAGSPNPGDSVPVKRAFDPNDVEKQINTLKDAYSDVELVILIIPGVPIIHDNTPLLEDEKENSLIEILDQIPGLHILYPRNSFIELYTEHETFPRGFYNTLPGVGHLNSDGHFVIGAALADYLEGIEK